MRYEFIEQHSSQWPVKLQCRVLEVSRNAFYAWRRGHVGKRKQEDAEIMPLIKAVHEETGHTYGAEWIANEIRKKGRSIGKERVRRFMRHMGLKVQCKNSFKVLGTTNSSETYQPSPDLVNRKFHREEPDSLWLSDFSELPSLGPKLYAVAIKDQASHRILGLYVSESLHTGTLISVFYSALQTRNILGKKAPRPIIFHSDQGGQYNAKVFKNLLLKHGLESSMGTTGDCYDNAPMESFWATMKTEIMHHFPFRDLGHARAVIYRWLHLFYNLRRRHTSIRGMSPVEYEAAWFRKSRVDNVADVS